MPSTPLTPEQRALLSAVGAAELPQPIPSGLLTLPIFRAAAKLGRLADDGTLADESAWRTRLVMPEPAGRYTAYEITGDPKRGLPYGGDADVLLAMAALADRLDLDGRPYVDASTGEFAAPSLRMIARVLDLGMTKERAERIRGALERLAAVRIRASRLRQLADIGGGVDPVALPAGNAQPVWVRAADDGDPPPLRATAAAERGRPRGGRPSRVSDEVAASLPAGRWVSEAEGTEFLITYAWRTEYHRSAKGEDWISKLQINPALLAHGHRGWVGWIDCPTHAKLTRPIAKRLYQLTANAQARQAPLRFELGALRQLCGIATESRHFRMANLREDVRAAAAELVAHDVLAGAEAIEVARGRYVFHFEPGLRLRVAGWLRGVGTPEFTDRRVLRLLLASLDVAPVVAERLVAESAGQVRQMLAYVFYQRDRGQSIRAPGRYVVDGVTAGWSYDAQEEFQRWMRQRIADAGGGAPFLDDSRSTGDAPAGTSPLGPAAVGAKRITPSVASDARRGDVAPSSAPAVSSTPPREEPALALPVLPSAERAWWDAATAVVGPSLHGLVRAYLDRARPAARADVTLLVVAHSDGEGARLAREADQLAAELARVSGGAVCEVLVLGPAQWAARAADLAVDAAAARPLSGPAP